jgi:hypothetical protein
MKGKTEQDGFTTFIKSAVNYVHTYCCSLLRDFTEAERSEIEMVKKTQNLKTRGR